jgi:hypothetical protein
MEKRLAEQVPGLATETKAGQPARTVRADRMVWIEEEVEDLCFRDDCFVTARE